MIRSILMVAMLAALAACQTTSRAFDAFTAQSLSTMMTSICVPNMGNIHKIEEEASDVGVASPQIEKFILLGHVEDYRNYQLLDNKNKYGEFHVYGDGNGCGVSFPTQEETKVLIVANIGAEMFPKRSSDGSWMGVIERRGLIVIVSDEPSTRSTSSVMVFDQGFLKKLGLSGSSSGNTRYIPRN